MSRTLLISIHPKFVDLIIKGEKRIEFRRSWAKDPVDRMVIYATAPVMRIVAIVSIAEVFRESKTVLWELAKAHGGGLSRQELRTYFNGKQKGYGICLKHVQKFKRTPLPLSLFNSFQIPQSFRYLTDYEVKVLEREFTDKD